MSSVSPGKPGSKEMFVVHVGKVFFVARRGQELTAALKHTKKKSRCNGRG